MPLYYDNASDEDGRIVPNATITVHSAGTTNLYPIFSNEALTQVKANPFFASETGYFDFFAIGRIKVTISKPGSIDKVVDNITLLPNKIGGTVALAANFLVPNVVATTVIWDTEAYDSSTFINIAADPTVITVPPGMGGTYLFTGNGTFAAKDLGNRKWGIFRGATLIASSDNLNAIAGPSGTFSSSHSVSDLVDLAPADTMTTVVQHDSGGAGLNIVAGARMKAFLLWF